MTASAVTVWVQGLASGVPAWAGGTWTEQPRLIPDESTQTDGSIGQASFRMLRRRRSDDKRGETVDTFSPVVGQYIIISDAGGASPFATTIHWAGRITGVHPQAIGGEDDEIGSVDAVEIGAQLDAVPVANLVQYNPGLFVQMSVLLTNPSANMARADGVIIGNMYTPSNGVPIFQSDPASCTTSNRWDKYNLLAHVLTYASANTAIPTLSLSMDSGLATYLQASLLAVLELDTLTIKGLIDTLVGATSGMTWRVIPTGIGWTITVASASSVGIGTFPAATAVDIALDGDDEDLIYDGGGDRFDAVEVIGEPIVCAGTVSPLDGSAGKGWSATQEAAYLAAASASAGYSALGTDKQCARNRGVRKSGPLQDVFARIQLNAYNSTVDLACKGVAGIPNGTLQPFCPFIDWDGTTASVNASVGGGPYVPGASLLNTLPWQVGVRADGTHDNTATQVGQPTYMQPVVLRYLDPADPNVDAWPGWSDLVHPPSTKWPMPTVHADERGAALKVGHDHAETLGKGHWSGAAVSEYSPDLTTSFGATDWQTLVMTVAMESDQRVKARILRTGVTSAQVRNTLRIYRTDLHCWLIRKYTILGLKADGTPDEVAADTFSRNDFAVAQKLAQEAAAFAFREATSGTITLIEPATPPAWAVVGTLIGTIDDHGQARSFNTVVRSVRRSWSPNRPRIMVATDYGSFENGIGNIASVSLGGTVGGSLQRARGDIADLQRDVQRMPIIAGTQAKPVAQGRTETITQTAHGFAVGNWVQNNTDWTSGWEIGNRESDAAQDGRTVVGRVLEVVTADRFVVALEGLHHITGTSYVPYTYYYLGTLGDDSDTPANNPTSLLTKSQPLIDWATHLALPDDWIYIFSPRAHRDHNHYLSDAVDVAVDLTSHPIADGDVLTWEAATALWKAKTPGAGSLALDDLSDVTIASVADLNFLRYDHATSLWKNYDLGPMTYAAASSELAFDGGSTAIRIGLGATGSRLILSGAPSPLDFLLSGSVAAGTDISARIRRVSSTQVSFYDQGTTTTTAGTEVLRWNCNSSAGSRSFGFMIPVSLLGNKLYADFGAAPTASYFDMGSGGPYDGAWHQSGNIVIDAGTKTSIRGNANVAGSSSTLSFFEATGATFQSVSPRSATTTVGTASGSYTGTEQTMLNALKADVIAMATTVDALRAALHAYGQV